MLAGRRERLEQVCRYVLRPPVSADRLKLTDTGQVHLTFKQPWRDGTTAVVFDLVTFLGRLAVLVPRPHVLLWRARCPLGVARGRCLRRRVPADSSGPEPACEGTAASAGPGRPANQSWATLMRRACGFDVLSCPRRGGRLRLVALIAQPAVIARILRHVGKPIEIPRARPARQEVDS